MIFSFSILFSLLLTSPIYAESNSIIVSTDKDVYGSGETLTVSGFVEQITMPVIALQIYDPSGTILTANNVDVDSIGAFSKTIVLEPPFYEESGLYLIKLEYGKVSTELEFEVESDTIEETSEENFTTPEIVLLVTDELEYNDNDTITITGLVSSIDSPSALVGIYDPFGTPTGFYFGEIDQNKEFTVSFLAKAGVNFKIDGTYSVEAHYGDSKTTAYFDFYELNSFEEPVNEPIDENNDEKGKNRENTNRSDETKQNSNVLSKENKKEKNNELPKDSLLKTKSDVAIKNSDPKKDNSKSKIETKNYDNLSVEDVELGKLLNEIKLNCDNSNFFDIISYEEGMGPALLRLCRYNAAITMFDNAISKEQNNVSAISNKGVALAKLGYYDKAMKHFDEALMIDSSHYPAINNKANILSIQGNYQEATTLYKQAKQLSKGNSIIQQNLDKAYLQISKPATYNSNTQIVNNTENNYELEEKKNEVKFQVIIPEKVESIPQSGPIENLIRYIANLFYLG